MKTSRLIISVTGLAALLCFSACDKKTAIPAAERVADSKPMIAKSPEAHTSAVTDDSDTGEAVFAGAPDDLAMRRKSALKAKDAKALVALGREVRKIWEAKEPADAVAFPDFKKFVASLFADAARLGSAEGMLLAGRCAAQGFGEERDLKKAFALFLSAGESGEAAGYNEAARILISGKAGPPDLPGAMALIERALEKGSAEAQFLKGTLLLGQGGEFASAAITLLMDAARADNADAQQLLAKLYREGKYVPKDDKAAAEWTKYAADLGLASANAELASLVLNGKASGDENISTAMDRLIFAAGQGNANAALDLARMYRSTENPTAEERALVWHYAQQAFDGGRPDAALLMAISVPYGDHEAAMEWLRKGAQAQDWRSKYAYQLAKFDGTGIGDAVMTAMRATQEESMRYFSEKWSQPAGTLDGPPAIITAKEPVMPAALTSFDLKSEIKVIFVVDTNGVPRDVKIHESSPYEELNKAAIEAVSQWRFKPGMKNGKAVNTRMLLPVTFQAQR